MPASYRIDPDHHFLHVNLYGVVTGRDVSNVLADMFADPLWMPGCVVLWDTRGMQFLTLEPQDVARVARIAEGVGPERGTSRTAILTMTEEAEDLARLFERRTRTASGEHNETRLFRNVAEAARWLGLCDDVLCTEADGLFEQA